jgi:hypothetical protein
MDNIGNLSSSSIATWTTLEEERFFPPPVLPRGQHFGDFIEKRLRGNLQG